MMSSTPAVRLVLCAATLFGLGMAGITPALATNSLASAFGLRYPASTTLTAAGCGNTCHGGTTSTYNSYGRDLRLATGTNDQRLAAIEGLDSDKEGNSNLVEITRRISTVEGVRDLAMTPSAINPGPDPFHYRKNRLQSR